MLLECGGAPSLLCISKPRMKGPRCMLTTWSLRLGVGDGPFFTRAETRAGLLCLFICRIVSLAKKQLREVVTP